MGLMFSSSEPSADVKSFVDGKIKDNKVMVFSKTTCPYCKMAKTALKEVDAEFEVVELNQRSDGSAIQSYLAQITGASTVPRVFIGGKCIGGGTETKTMQKNGQLAKLISAA